MRQCYKGQNQVIECQVGSIKTKRRLPSQTPQKPCQLLPRREPGLTGDKKPRIREDRGRQVNRQVSPAVAGLHLHVSTRAGNPGTFAPAHTCLPGCVCAPLNPPNPPGLFETFLEGQTNSGDAPKSSRQV